MSCQFSDEAINMSRNEMCSKLGESLDGLLTTRSKFIDDELFKVDIHQMLKICEHWTHVCLINEQQPFTHVKQLLHFWNITEFLFNSSLVKHDDFSRYRTLHKSFSPCACLPSGWSLPCAVTGLAATLR